MKTIFLTLALWLLALSAFAQPNFEHIRAALGSYGPWGPGDTQFVADHYYLVWNGGPAAARDTVRILSPGIKLAPYTQFVIADTTTGNAIDDTVVAFVIAAGGVEDDCYLHPTDSIILGPRYEHGVDSLDTIGPSDWIVGDWHVNFFYNLSNPDVRTGLARFFARDIATQGNIDGYMFDNTMPEIYDLIATLNDENTDMSGGGIWTVSEYGGQFDVWNDANDSQVVADTAYANDVVLFINELEDSVSGLYNMPNLVPVSWSSGHQSTNRASQSFSSQSVMLETYYATTVDGLTNGWWYNEYIDSLIDSSVAYIPMLITSNPVTGDSLLKRRTREGAIAFYHVFKTDSMYFCGASAGYGWDHWIHTDTNFYEWPSVWYNIGTPDSARYIIKDTVAYTHQHYVLRRDFTRSDGQDYTVLYLDKTDWDAMTWAESLAVDVPEGYTTEIHYDTTETTGLSQVYLFENTGVILKSTVSSQKTRLRGVYLRGVKAGG